MVNLATASDHEQPSGFKRLQASSSSLTALYASPSMPPHKILFRKAWRESGESSWARWGRDVGTFVPNEWLITPKVVSSPTLQLALVFLFRIMGYR
ncbi:hypothetical protein AB1N83_001055 [Pleurotus pulmonarius]